MYFLRIALIAIVACWAFPGGSVLSLNLNLDFSQDRQTYYWADSASIQHNFRPSLRLALQNRSTATLIKESVFGQGGDRWQKTARTAGAVTYRIDPAHFAGIEFAQDFDRLEAKRLIANRVYLVGGLEEGHVSVTQRGGIVWEERLFEPARNRESGFGYSGAVSLTPRRDRSFGSARVEGEITALRRTPSRNITLDYDFARNGLNGDTITLAAKQSFGQKKYFPSSGNFDATARQQSEQRRWDLHSSQRLPAHLMLTSDAAYRFDSYDYEYEPGITDLIRQHNNFTSLFEYQFALTRRFGRTLMLQGSYLFNRTKEDFGELQTTQIAETGRLGMITQLCFLQTDTVTLSGQAGVTSYLAPTVSTYFADRDRSTNVVSLRATHRFSEYLTGVMDGSYRGFHLVYISGTLSANNNINNVYILNPTLIWKPTARLTLQQDYQMFANYIYYEYEKTDLSGRNTLYRRVNWSNRLTVVSSVHTDFVFEYSYRYEDFGPLAYSDQWQQQVSWDRRTHRPRLGIDYRLQPGVRFQPYTVYEIQRSFDHVFDSSATLGTRQKSEELTRTLVGFDFRWELSNASELTCKLERRVQDYSNQRSQDYNLLTISIKRYF